MVLMLTKTRETSNKVLTLIANAFLRQSYPLTEEGMALKDDLTRVMLLKDTIWLGGNVWRLPTVEYPHPELFADLDFGSLGEGEVMGHKLMAIQSHLGCTHQCIGFCDSCAPRRIVQTMPFAAVHKIADAKFHQDRRSARIMLNFLDNLKKQKIMPCGESEAGVSKMSLVPRDERELNERINSMKGNEFYRFVKTVDALCERHPVASIFRQWPMLEISDPATWIQHIWQHYWHYIPIMSRSIMLPIHSFNGNDPIEYGDRRFRHLGGEPADYGDVFLYQTSWMRPIFLSTAGWLPTNQIAERAAQKLVRAYKKDKLFSGGVRLTVKRYEILARTDPRAYVENLKRMIAIFWPMMPEDLTIEIYQDPKIEGDQRWAESIHAELEAYATSVLGGSLGIDGFVEVSHKLGRAYDPRYAEADHDSTGDAWGYHIMPNGRVYWRDEVVFKEFHDDKTGIAFYKLQSPSKRPVFTGVKLW
jgi:hypothetical protein